MDCARACLFYDCTGYCRHGTECKNKHTIVTSGRMVMLRNIIPRIKHKTRAELYRFYDHCFEDIFLRLAKLGPLQDFLVAENTNHLAGTVYALYTNHVAAQDVVGQLADTHYAGYAVKTEIIRPESFHRVLCKDKYGAGKMGKGCALGLSCNFVHKFLPQQDMWENMKPLLARVQRPLGINRSIRQ